MNPLEQQLDYKFTNSLLLAEALTHSSLAYETQSPHFDNQRLEFLGDAVLQLCLTDVIYTQHPTFDEGQMTNVRSRLVSKEALHQFAIALNLSEFILMGKGEVKSGGQHRASTLADALEAILGAIYLDGGFDAAFKIIKRITEQAFLDATNTNEEKNPKGKLQEILQGIFPESPTYEVISESGPDHDKNFLVKILWAGHELATGEGNSKKLAERKAAAEALNNKSWENRTL